MLYSTFNENGQSKGLKFLKWIDPTCIRKSDLNEIKINLENWNNAHESLFHLQHGWLMLVVVLVHESGVSNAVRLKK